MKDYPRCKTCRFWNQKTEDFGTCENPKIISGVGGTFDDPDRKDIHVPDVFTMSGAYHSCGENFGCVHHVELGKRRGRGRVRSYVEKGPPPGLNREGEPMS